MPETSVVFYQEADAKCPVLDWLYDLQRRDRRAFANCVAVIRRLAMLDYELRRPQAAYLRDGIHELRARRGRVNYRILYFFHGRNATVLTHALTKEAKVPDVDIERALVRMRRFEQDPIRYTRVEDVDRG